MSYHLYDDQEASDAGAHRPLDQVAAQGFMLGLLIVAGLAAGAAWRYLLPFFLDHSDRQEAYIAVDGSLALITAVAGLLTGVVVVIRPGRYPAWRGGVAIVGSIAAAALAWGTGVMLGAPDLLGYGVLLFWAVITAVTLFIASMLPIVGDRLNPR